MAEIAQALVEEDVTHVTDVPASDDAAIGVTPDPSTDVTGVTGVADIVGQANSNIVVQLVIVQAGVFGFFP